MSFSPFEDFMHDLAEMDSQNTGESRLELTAFQDDPPLADARTICSLDDTLSLNETLQDLGSIITLPPGSLTNLLETTASEDDGETMAAATIVSSAASAGCVPPPPEESQSVFAISPHPCLLPNSVQGLSTVCTDTLSYQRMHENETNASLDDRDDHSTSASASSQIHMHGRETFTTVANQLVRDTSQRLQWSIRFTDYDWDQMREISKVVMTMVDPTHRPWPVPPTPPASNHSSNFLNDLSVEYHAEDIVPSSFVCSICKDAVVGAVTLDCGCADSTVCNTCWHAGNSIEGIEPQKAGYEFVDQRQCPSCKGQVNSATQCHALDVAILRIVSSLESKDPKTRSLKQNYNSRLADWREAVLARNQVDNDELLARLIQEEQQVLLESRETQERSLSRWKHALFLGQAAVAVAVAAATMASVVIRTYIRR